MVKHPLLMDNIRPTVYSDEAIKRLLSIEPVIEQKNPMKSMLMLRNIIMLRIMIYTGVKIGDLANLRMRDVENVKSDRNIKFTIVKEPKDGFKGQKEKSYQISIRKDLILGLFDKYLEFLSEIRGDSSESDLLFISKSKREINPKDMKDIYRKIFDEVEVEFLSTKSFRHTFARKKIHEVIKIKRLTELLGYRNEKSTREYFHIYKPHSKDARRGVGRIVD
jgi:site-specific recombinase XerD